MHPTTCPADEEDLDRPMLSARRLFEEIRANDDAYAFLLSIAAKNEAQGGWENERIADLTPDPELAAKIRRHGEDEATHGRLFAALLAKRGLSARDVPPEADYCMLLERLGIGLAHERLYRDDLMTVDDIIVYLAHSRVTEQRSAEEIELQRRYFDGDSELKKGLTMVANDEVNHLYYCHEELLKLCESGHRQKIETLLKDYARAEASVYKQVGLVFVRRMSTFLGWSTAKTAVLIAGVYITYLVERVWRWRRMVRLEVPPRRNALFSGSQPAAAT